MWIILLRAVGTTVFLFGTLGSTYRLLVFRSVGTWVDFIAFSVPILETLALAVLCFAAAAALRQLQHNAHTLNALAHMTSQRDVQPQPPLADAKDLAPVAPNWDRLPEPVALGYLDRRLAQRRRSGITEIIENKNPRVPARRRGGAGE